jgi:TRAP-type C4-dicarboxylate transport system permease small subunit
MGPSRFAGALLGWLTTAGHAVSAGTLIFLTVLITVEIVLRAAFGTSLLVVDELSGDLLVLLTFFGANHALRTGSLLRVDFLFSRMPVAGQRVAALAFDVVCGAFCAILTWYFGRLVVSSYSNDVVSSTMASTPMFIPQLAMPLGTGLMALTFLLMALEKVGGRTPVAAPAEMPHVVVTDSRE